MMMLVLCFVTCGDCNARGEECVCLNIGMGINRRVTCIYRRGAIFGALFWTSSKVEMVILMGNVTKSFFFFLINSQFILIYLQYLHFIYSLMIDITHLFIFEQAYYSFY